MPSQFNLVKPIFKTPCQAYVQSAMINNQKLKAMVSNQKLKTKVSINTATSKFIPKCNGKQSREDVVRHWHIYLVKLLDTTCLCIFGTLIPLYFHHC